MLQSDLGTFPFFTNMPARRLRYIWRRGPDLLSAHPDQFHKSNNSVFRKQRTYSFMYSPYACGGSQSVAPFPNQQLFGNDYMPTEKELVGLYHQWSLPVPLPLLSRAV